MDKKEYWAKKESLGEEESLEKDQKILLLKEEKKQFSNGKKNLREEYGIQKKESREERRKIHQEFRERREYLKGIYRKNKEPRVNEKYLSQEEIEKKRKALKLPSYTYGEEVFNMVTHIVGGGLSIVTLILSIVFALHNHPGEPAVLLSFLAFSFGCIFLYTVSATYHGLRINKGKQVFQVLDHCTIYAMIACCYTPVCLLGLSSHVPYNYVLLGLVYFGAVLGIALNATMMRKIPVKVVSYILYIGIGWGIIFCYRWLLEGKMGTFGTWMLIGGGIVYTVGCILYASGSRKRYWHSIFHLFVLAGTMLQYIGLFVTCLLH